MRRPVGVIAVLVSVLAVLAIVVAMAMLVPRDRPSLGDGLTGITWQWTATTTLGDAVPSIVPDPSSYTVEFGGDGRFRAKADCTGAAGTYRVIPPGRMGPNPGLVITPDAGDPTPCGAGSLSEAFVAGLGRATGYSIVDGRLTITLDGGTRMAFRQAAQRPSSSAALIVGWCSRHDAQTASAQARTRAS